MINQFTSVKSAEKCDIISYANDVLTSLRSNVMKIDSQDNNPEILKICEYSNSQIKNAGKTVISHGCTEDEYFSSLSVLYNWRAAHRQPLQIIADELQRQNPNGLVMQRLKRLESITGKLSRYPEMNLYKMQDLGGCRIILDSTEDVYNAANNFKAANNLHILKREDDYIKNPKESGYRSYHLVYRFNGSEYGIDTCGKNMLIEIQFRTKIQHIWATAVEMMGLMTDTDLKSSMGNPDILRFFRLVSSLYAFYENFPFCPNTPQNRTALLDEIRTLNDKYNILSILNGLNVSANFVDKSGEKKETFGERDYFLLILDYDLRQVQALKFTVSDVAVVTELYNKVETQIALNPNSRQNAVLVSADSFNDLIKGYPNYFADIRDFIGSLTYALDRTAETNK